MENSDEVPDCILEGETEQTDLFIILVVAYLGEDYTCHSFGCGFELQGFSHTMQDFLP